MSVVLLSDAAQTICRQLWAAVDTLVPAGRSRTIRDPITGAAVVVEQTKNGINFVSIGGYVYLRVNDVIQIATLGGEFIGTVAQIEVRAIGHVGSDKKYTFDLSFTTPEAVRRFGHYGYPRCLSKEGS